METSHITRPMARTLADALRRGEGQRRQGPQGRAAAAATEELVAALLMAARETAWRETAPQMLERLDRLAGGEPTVGPLPDAAPKGQRAFQRAHRQHDSLRAQLERLVDAQPGITLDGACEAIGSTRRGVANALSYLRRHRVLVAVDGRHYRAETMTA